MTGEFIEVQRVVVNLMHRIDAKCWSELEQPFASEVESDYTSLFGGTPQRQSSAALVAGWRGLLAKVTTQHLLGPLVISFEGQRAEARCHVRAMHYVAGASGGDSWEVLGHYVFQLQRGSSGWRIERLTLQTYHQIGNCKLLAGSVDSPH